MSEIARLISKLAKAGMANKEVFICTVEAVNEDKQLCDVKMLGTDVVLNVSLTSLDGKAKKTAILKVPKLGSRVAVQSIEGMMVVTLVEEVEALHLRGDKYTLIKGEELLAEIEKLKATVDALVNALSNWTPVSQDGGAALQAFLTPLLVGKTTGNFKSLENKNVKHG